MRVLLFFLFCYTIALGQYQKPIDGVRNPIQNSFVLTNVSILVSPGNTIPSGSIVVRDGKIVAVNKSTGSLPTDLPLIDGKKAVVVPAFIELNTSAGISTEKKLENNIPQSYWNNAIRAEFDAATWIDVDSKKLEELQKMGFGLAFSHRNEGLAQGYGTLINTGQTESNYSKSKLAAYYSFRKGSSPDNYPSSLVGSIALLRQAQYDAKWHQQYGKETNYSLDALADQFSKPAFFSLSNAYDIFRVKKLAREFNRNFIAIGTGEEQFLGRVWDTLTIPLVIPINFPAPYELSDPFLAHQIPYSELKNWEMAPKNPAFLFKQKQNFAVTATGHTKASDFWKHVHQALANGWTEDDALRALTQTPANLLGIGAENGSIETSKWATFNLYSKNPFQYEATLLESYSNGERKIFESLPDVDIRGTYSLNVDGVKYWLNIKGSADKLSAEVTLAKVKSDTTAAEPMDSLYKSKVSIAQINNDINLAFRTAKNSFQLKGEINPRLLIFEGEGTNQDGRWIKWSAICNKKAENKADKLAWNRIADSVQPILFPNSSFGFTQVPTPQTIIIEDATIWTNEDAGIIQEGTVVVENGKIKAIHKGSGSFVKPNNAVVINGKGKVLTSGIIDEHSHIALTRGVNEGSQSVTCEVRMQDAINSEDIDIYRQLAGGVTAAQLLHGSANPIGGQSALIKLKWGHYPDEYLIKNAPKFVKFALGENVKQSNWGVSNRFPQTRMGVEQVFIDAFSRATAYQKQKNNTSTKEKNPSTPTPVELELEALSEIVRGERKISCHSYVQSEINMLMHVADSFGFKVNTFTHVLEGYKIADKLMKHVIGASTFADWWAYKFEVMEAIPYNAALMTKQGLTVAINSDDAEMGRRLNQEAAKTIKYGGMSEDQAWKMVTLNPAKMLHLDDRMGSIKVGKDADLVLWTNNPLSITAKPIYTIVDGEILYDAQREFTQFQAINKEKNSILLKMKDAVQNGSSTKNYQPTEKGHFHCNTLGEEASHGENEH
jgi:imidazolonepropionase-like amidohydrolase